MFLNQMCSATTIGVNTKAVRKGTKTQTNLISEGSLNGRPQAEPPILNLQINPPSGPAADGVTVCWFPAFDFLLKGRGRWEIELP